MVKIKGIDLTKSRYESINKLFQTLKNNIT